MRGVRVLSEENCGAVDQPLFSLGTCNCEQDLYLASLNEVDCGLLNIMYWYQADYPSAPLRVRLGSVEFVTDNNGAPYQFFFNTPFGENLENQFVDNYRSFESRFRFNGKEWDEETGNFYYGARYYDPKVSVWLSVDPLAHLRTWVSPYNFVQNNPIMRTDPTGALDGEYDVTHDKDGNEVKTKTSTLGDAEGIDLFHQMDGDRKGDTKIVNNNSGTENWISGGVGLIRGYTQRGNGTNWNSIFSEWKSESGPQNSLMFGRDNTMNQQIRTSNLYLGVRNDYLEKKAWDFNGNISKGKELVSFAKYKEGFKSVLLSGSNMTMQMLGSANVSFYDIGNHQRLTIINDSKTFESYNRLPLPMTLTLDRIPTRATRQTYMWIDNNVEP